MKRDLASTHNVKQSKAHLNIHCETLEECAAAAAVP